VPEDYEPEAVQQALLRDAWRRSQIGRETRFIHLGAIGIAICFGLTLTLVAKIDPSSANGQPFTRSQTEASAAGWAIAVVVYYLSNLYTRSRRALFFDHYLIEKYGQLGEDEAKLLEEEKLGLGPLWGLTEDRLRIYHEIATRQAQASFRNAQYAISAGFIVIIVGAYAAYSSKNTAIAIVVGSLGTAGAALSAYIGKTFLRLQENAAAHLRSYFDQPKEQFRYLAAERLLSHIKNDERRADTVDKIIEGIVSADRAKKNEQ
jgi:hypothetical protein